MTQDIRSLTLNSKKQSYIARKSAIKKGRRAMKITMEKTEKGIQARQQVTEALLEKHILFLTGLYDRWCCEKKYEDFSEYEAVMRAKIPGFICGSKKPFGAVVKIEDFPYDVLLFVKSSDVHGWKSAIKKIVIRRMKNGHKKC